MIPMLWSKKFWIDAIERTLSTSAVIAAATIGTTALVQNVNWAIVGGTTASAAVLTLLKCVGASRVGDSSSASLVE